MDSGFPHSEIFGSKLTYSSPKHIGVSAVLHRLLVPRGDPAAPSDTATLLRLHPNHLSHLRRLAPLRVTPPTSGVTNSRGVTGGVYKTRERIHRGMLIHDY